MIAIASDLATSDRDILVTKDLLQSIRAPKALQSVCRPRANLISANRTPSHQSPRLTLAIGGKYFIHFSGFANSLISSLGTPINSMIWN